MIVVRTAKLPGDIELIGNGTRRELHRYDAGSATADKSHRLSLYIARNPQGPRKVRHHG